MELDRKAFHFDLDNESVERFYTGKRIHGQTFRTFWNPIALKSHNILDMNRLKISSCPINVLMAP